MVTREPLLDIFRQKLSIYIGYLDKQTLYLRDKVFDDYCRGSVAAFGGRRRHECLADRNNDTNKVTKM
jgi:hypothetical protein